MLPGVVPDEALPGVLEDVVPGEVEFIEPDVVPLLDELLVLGDSAVRH